MYTKVWLCVIFVGWAHGLPTVYKYNQNKILEPDLVPVSSTVIPLPIYRVSSGLQVAPNLKDDKVKKPEGPITLLTIHSKKKVAEQPKAKPSDVSSVKQVSKTDFNN
ncbi:uncharacterized protein LOC100141997 isoform X3 [Tribolium castaneum]|uniref:Uncharacterized protein n=1 Tax=Tribolium castaneum TaxID=7070 RepID=D2A5T2_TRICA|nr:PREDICTED: uncharacterized protein LOC100141997 [Tribolium castaneum]EFA05414.2 hypothetical protein TcasGA2_TC015590 [Tribolium castaneum]|eukprot:XP_001806936.1 PREDICTED: uncharacterized protein LOC100141997 [Tribolium castaneum]